MKIIAKQIVFIMLLSAFFVLEFSCKKDKSVETVSAVPVLTTGTWSIVFMADSGVTNTNEYQDYTFIFNTNGELTAANSSGTTVGYWYAESDDHGDDEFRMALGNFYPLSNLSRRWHIRSSSANKVELYDDEYNHDDKCTFQKL